MLAVVFGNLRNAHRSRWPDDGRTAWRVSHRIVRNINGEMAYPTLPMPFAREQDAVAAMKAIADMADWTQPYDVLIKQLDLDTVRLRMVEAMAW